MNNIIIENISNCPSWKKIFSFILNTCNEFQVIFPLGEYDIENPLMGGMIEFKNLDNITIEKTTEYIDEYINKYLIISGKLEKHSKKLFKELVEPTFSNDSGILCQFNLYKDKSLYLSISDFNVCILEKTPEILKYLEVEKIKI